jgi:CheY-like chemotaxis protein
MKKQVLVVDDAMAVRRYLVRLFDSAGFEVRCASTGEQAIAIMREQADLDLVLLDFNMPGMNGLSVLQWMRSTAETTTLPVIMFTTESSSVLIERAKELGAAAWIVKPPDLDELLVLARGITSKGKPSGNSDSSASGVR